MKVSPEKLERRLEIYCKEFATNLANSISQFLDIEVLDEEGVFVDSPLAREQIHVSVFFSGSIYGEYFLSLSKEVACGLAGFKGDSFDKNQREIFDILQEIINIAVGGSIQRINRHFKHLTISSPKISFGQIELPKLPSRSINMSTGVGGFICTLYIDQMKLKIVEKYAEKSRMLSDSEVEKEQLNRLNSTKSEFLANMSHELRTPLNGIIGYIDLLKATTLSSIQRQHVETIAQSGDFLLSIINDILEFSKIESGRLEIENRSFDIASSIESFVNSISNQIYEKGLEFIVNAEPGVKGTFVSDETRIRQVLMNLIGNATKFTPKGVIILEVKRNDGSIEFSVEDTGVGIPAAKLKTIFDSFSQADLSDNRKYGGSGLGLTISKSIVEALGGRIFVESEEAVGSRFGFTLPCQNICNGEVPDDLHGSKLQRKCLIYTKSSFLEKSIKYYIKEVEAKDVRELESFGDSFVGGEIFSEKEVVFFDWSIWRGLSERVKSVFRKSTLDKKIDLVFLMSPSELNEIKEEVETYDIKEVSLVTKPLTQTKLLKVFNKELTVSRLEMKSELQLKSERPKKTGKVLLVEDNLINQQVAKAMLEVLGFRVDLAANGEEALSATRDTKYDMIFMDCQMPVMDGYLATQKIRADLENTNFLTPIIALTANAFREIKERCFECGMDDFATKPLKQIDLAKVVEKYC